MKNLTAVSVFVLSSCLTGCKHTSALTPMYLGGASGAAPAAAERADENGCGWVEVSEEHKRLFSSTVRQYDDALFYCCPTEEGKAPECREAKWLERD